MIPARIGQSRKKIYEPALIDGKQYRGIWQGYFCWIKDDDGKIIHRFETKSGVKGTINVRVIYRVPRCYIYEILPKR